MKTRICFITVFSFFVALLPAQVSFVKDANFSDAEPSKSLLPVSLADVNGDGWDDITRIKNGKSIEINFFGNMGQSYFQKEVEVAHASDIWSVAIGNFDRSLKNKVLLSTAFDDIDIVGLDAFENPSITQSLQNQLYSQASNIVDINNDGWNDVFVSMDDGTSKVFINDGTGMLVERDDVIDLNTAIPSDNSGNYGSEWMDIDSDGDLDLYLSKCKAGVSDPNDPRRVNALYLNDGHQNYTESAERFGLDFGAQSWASSFSDLDNDGDLDGIIIHHGAPHSLLENINNESFLERDELLGDLKGTATQVVVRDFDNNGFQDILIVGETNDFYWNQGNFNFIKIENPFPAYILNSLSTGDINRDGFLDVLAVYGGIGFNESGEVNDILWLNEKNQNAHITFHLKGIESNPNGIGARVEIYGDWGIQIRDVKSGESYGIMNSLNVHFGIGEATTIDKVIVKWPSGQIDDYGSFRANDYFILTEGRCVTKFRSQEESLLQICDGLAQDIGGANVLPSALWSNSLVGKSFPVSQSGVYFYKEEDGHQCVRLSDPIIVQNIDGGSEALYTSKDLYVACEGEELVIQYGTSPDKMSEQIIVLDQGSVVLQMDGICSDLEKVVDVQTISTNEPIVQNYIVKEDQMLTITAEGQHLRWFEKEQDEIPFIVGDSLTIGPLKSSMELFVESQSITKYPSQNGGEITPSASSLYHLDHFSGGLYFDAKTDIIIENVAIYTDRKGERELLILDNEGGVVYNRFLYVEEGRNELNLQAEIPYGDQYFITTSEDYNEGQFGFISPRFVRSNMETDYPYQIGDLVDITNSSFGPGYWLYFYNWNVRPADLICSSPKVAVQIELDFSTPVIEELAQSIKVFPNPVGDMIHIQNETNEAIVQIKMYNQIGQNVMTQDANSFATSSLLPGLYYIEILLASEVIVKRKIVKI